ncbi:MAG: TonB-dependent receptor plug domain-containing protein [Cephaloticoccus sp.]|nr:TonB-dependent receptor plug domain-containing protein [Cephaloticoccus sp.]MCF7758938.1 TonB-dependent receptor plug domain-containing protein [Cephaloticoccus sp.]
MNSSLNRKLLTVFAACLPFALTAQTVESSDVVTLEKFEVTEMKSFSDQAIAGKTPVSFSEIGKETIASELGSRDIPLVLNATPSVYASADSGGAGDSRVNVRGFNQRNVSILINGVPTNDIENGWLYWSNWDGLGDVTSTIQMQRGLSNVTLPTPSIGGTMNIITDPASNKRGGSLKTEVGNDGFLKGTAVFNTGLLQDKVALTVGLVAKTGDGFVRGTWTDGYGYYIGASWKVNQTNRLELFAIGAPQTHGQRTFASNIAAYDSGYAKSLGYSEADLTAALGRGPVNAGNEFNPNYAPVAASYSGQQYYWGSTHSRHDGGFINERENYFNKPQVNLNWYSTISDQLKINSVFYFSGGFGGGSGTLYNTGGIYGFQSSSRAFGFISNSDPQYGSAYDWDKTIAANAGTTTVRGDRTKPAGQSIGILRNSVNDQKQYGIVSKATYSVDDSLKLTAGVDWRTAEIEHYREIRDLLGGSYYIAAPGQYSEFDATGATRQMGLGEKVDYYNINTVDWLGLFAQVQYDQGPFSAFGVAAYSYVDYSYKDPFRKDANGGVYSLNPGKTDGQQIKGGVNYAINDSLNVFANAGWVSKVPVFDGVINDVTGRLVNTDNEEFKSGEFGLRYVSPDRKFNVSASYYYTIWDNRTVSNISEPNNTVTYLRGINSLYSGLEVEGAYQPNKWVRFDLAASIADWTYTDDVASEVNDITTGAVLPSSGKIYIKDLKVGDAPQSQVAYAVTVYPTRGLSIKLQGRWYDNYYADYLPETRSNSADRGQVWKIPSYNIYDLHVNYTLPLDSSKFDVSVFGHIFNLTDETYVSDATDNSSFEAISSAPSHSAQRAEVFLGLPISYNMGVKVKF